MLWTGFLNSFVVWMLQKLPLPGFEPGFSEPQSEVLTTILQ